MEKPSFYGIVGVSFFVIAVSLGYSASRFMSVRDFAPRSAAPARVAAGEPSGTPGSPPFERLNNIFAPDKGMEIPSRLVGSLMPAEAPKTRYVLLGTIASESRSARRAILWAEGMREPRIEREQAEVEPGVRLARIFRDHVLFERGKEQEKLEILPVGSRTRTLAHPAPPVATASTGTAPAAGEIHVSRLGENAFSLDEATVTQLTANINQYMANVRLIPYFEGNRSAGYRIAAIRPGTTFEQLGFKGGDVIQQVNSVELSTPDKVYTIFQNLKDEKHVTVNILRQGQKNSITYEIR